MIKKNFIFVSLVLLFLLLLMGVAGATENGTKFTVELVTASPLEVYAGERFAVSVRITPLDGSSISSIQLTALSAKNDKIAESAVLTNLESNVARVVILYGTIKQPGPMDISQIEIVCNSDSMTGEILSVDALLIQVREKEPVVVGTPRVFLKNYTLSKSSILAGDTITLTLYVENSSDREVRNLKVSLAAIPAENSTSGTVFSPVNSSNSFYVERIKAKNTYTKSINIYVDPNATAKTYLVPVEILYEDQQGTSYSVSEMVNIPVLQESRLQVIGVETPPAAAVGEPAVVTAEFVNAGKVALKNLLVTVEGDFLKENASYFLASFEIGQSEFFQAYIIPEAEDLLEGKVVFRYMDNTNQEVVEEWPFQIDVQPAGMQGPEEPMPADPPSSGFNYWLLLIPVVLILAVVGVLFWRRKVKSGEMFNEEL
ncbi:MAG: hypothetical protein AB1767_03500 [Bacillota bacterium]